MKHFFAAMLLLLNFFPSLLAQDISPDSMRTLYRSIQNFAYQSPTPWMENYAWLQGKEMPFFARDTFTMTWHFDPGTLLLLQENTPGRSWRAIFDPVWPNGGQQPIAERYEMRQMGCLELKADAQFITDIGFEFVLDTNLEVIEAIPQVSLSKNGFSRTLSPATLPEIDFRECVSVRFRGGEAGMPTLIGAHHRTMQKIRARADREATVLNRLIKDAVREAYPGFRITKIEPCHQPDRACWFGENGAQAETLKTYGKITAVTGPKEVFFEATVHFPEQEAATVKEVKIFRDIR